MALLLTNTVAMTITAHIARPMALSAPYYRTRGRVLGFAFSDCCNKLSMLSYVSDGEQ
jgi:hypothetical protein